MIQFVKLITAFADFMIMSLIALLSTESKSKNEFIGWMALIIMSVLSMILLWI